MALKIVEAIELDPSTKARFRLEARALCLLRHPHVVSIQDYGEAADGSVWIAMELLRGLTLHDEIRGAGALTVEHALGLTEQILRGVAACHDVGLLHRDLKPSNIFLTRPLGFHEDHVKLIDLGLAKELDVPSLLTSNDCVVGTMTYMSPEHGAGGIVDERSDLYSVGVVLREMIYGRADPTAPDQSTPAGMAPLPFDVQALLDTLLAFEPRARPASALEAIEQVREIRARVEATAARPPEATALHPPTLVGRGPTASGPWRWVALAVVLGFLAYALVAAKLRGGVEPVPVVASFEARPSEIVDAPVLLSEATPVERSAEDLSPLVALPAPPPTPSPRSRSPRKSRRTKRACPKGVTLTSIPSQAAVSVGRSSLGNTPMTLPAPRRARRLSIARDGYHPQPVVIDGSRCVVEVKLMVRDPTAGAGHASAGTP